MKPCLPLLAAAAALLAGGAQAFLQPTPLRTGEAPATALRTQRSSGSGSSAPSGDAVSKQQQGGVSRQGFLGGLLSATAGALRGLGLWGDEQCACLSPFDWSSSLSDRTPPPNR